MREDVTAPAVFLVSSVLYLGVPGTSKKGSFAYSNHGGEDMFVELTVSFFLFLFYSGPRI